MLMLSIVSLISSSAVTIRRDKSVLYARSVMSILYICLVININNFFSDFLDKGLGLYHGLFSASSTTHVFGMFIFIISGLILQLNAFYGRKVWINMYNSVYKLVIYKLIYYNKFILNKMAEQYRIIEYSLIILFIIIGGIFLMSCSNLISIFLCIELQSYGLYILCSVYRDSEKAVSAGLTYFLLGGLSSCFILLASGLLYANSGNMNFDALYILNNIASVSNNTDDSMLTSKAYLNQSHYINLALTIMSVGFLFKITAAPFHFWSPDVYDAIPTIVTTFVAIFTKISIFILLLQLVNYTGHLVVNDGSSKVFSFSWTYTFLISSVISMIIGSVLGLTQFRIKRLYAYSTINHVGFILLALTINSIESIQSFIFYLMQYSLANLNAFLLLITVGITLYIYIEKDESKDEYKLISDRKNSPLQLISQMKGYFYVNPTLAVSLAITLFSFVGIPPLVGFFAKQMVLSSALDKGYVFVSIVAILTSVISAYYYLALIKQIFFFRSDYTLNPQLTNVNIKGNIFNRLNINNINSIVINDRNIVVNGFLSITIAVLTLTILLFILNPQEWLSLANVLALIIFNC